MGSGVVVSAFYGSLAFGARAAPTFILSERFRCSRHFLLPERLGRPRWERTGARKWWIELRCGDRRARRRHIVALIGVVTLTPYGASIHVVVANADARTADVCHAD